MPYFVATVQATVVGSNAGSLSSLPLSTLDDKGGEGIESLGSRLVVDQWLEFWPFCSREVSSINLIKEKGLFADR